MHRRRMHSNNVTHSPLESDYLTFRVAAAPGCISFVSVFSLCGRLSVLIMGRSGYNVILTRLY